MAKFYAKRKKSDNLYLNNTFKPKYDLNIIC